MNPIDTIVRSGKLRFRTGNQFPKRTGIDFVGEVVEIETEAPDIKVGDRVWGVMPLSVESGVVYHNKQMFSNMAHETIQAVF